MGRLRTIGKIPYDLIPSLYQGELLFPAALEDAMKYKVVGR